VEKFSIGSSLKTPLPERLPKKRVLPMEQSCGAVIFRNNKYLVLKYEWGHWGFVKGNVEKREKPEDVVYRETEEEAGITKEKLRVIPGFREKINYFYKKQGKTIYKEVIYLLAESKTNQVTLSYEHTTYEWLSYKEALEKITFDNAKNVLTKAHTFLTEKKEENR
jgi:8-oxo-dGTP pyrophosphatase MutT (NUDIX family)